MTPSGIRRGTVALAVTLAVAACSHPSQGGVAGTPAPAPHITSDSAAIAKARADSLRHPYTEADVYFMSGMIHHHAQALVMAGWAPSHGASPQVRTLCARIINSQQDEIATMQRWLSDRQLPVPAATATGMTMKMDGMEHQMLMPGMLTEDQMHQLDQARGAEFDRLFLVLMIQHHRGAITMVDQLFGSYGAGQDETVFKFASDVNVDQSTEIVRMEQMLAALPPAPAQRPS